jgi:hypothetical protein
MSKGANLRNAHADKLSLLLNDIESNCNPAVGSEECGRFSLECLSLIQHKLPPIAVDAVGILNSYFSGQAQLSSVAEMLERSWQYLRKGNRDQNFDDPEVSAIRAVIFPLDAQKNPEMRDIVDHLSFFLGLVNNVEPHYEEEEMLLRKYFSECLEAR